MRARVSQNIVAINKMADLKGRNELAPGHFVQKQTVIFEENPKWRIYKGKIFVNSMGHAYKNVWMASFEILAK